MTDPHISEQCSKQALFFTKIGPNQSGWIAVGIMVHILIFSFIIVFAIASGGASLSVQRHRYIISTISLLLTIILTFILNLAFMHMKDCGPSEEFVAVVAVLAIFVGDIAAGVAILTWLIGTYVYIKAIKKDRERMAKQSQGRLDNQELRDYFSMPSANTESRT